MPRGGQKVVTLGGENLRLLVREYEKAKKATIFNLSFADFIASHALAHLGVKKNK